MPQDELWAASARSTGLRITLEPDLTSADNQALLRFAPIWSKKPRGRDGNCQLTVPGYALWSVPDLMRVAFTQWLGGDPKHVPIAVSHELKDVLREFEEGARS
jgi:hypothetical protein